MSEREQEQLEALPSHRAGHRWWVAAYHLVGVVLTAGALFYAWFLLAMVAIGTSSCGTPGPDDLGDLRRATLTAGLGVAAVSALWFVVGRKLTRSSIVWCALALVLVGFAVGSSVATTETSDFCLF